MNSAVWAEVAAEEAAGVRVGDQAEAEVTAGLRVKTG